MKISKLKMPNRVSPTNRNQFKMENPKSRQSKDWQKGQTAIALCENRGNGFKKSAIEIKIFYVDQNLKAQVNDRLTGRKRNIIP